MSRTRILLLAVTLLASSGAGWVLSTRQQRSADPSYAGSVIAGCVGAERGNLSTEALKTGEDCLLQAMVNAYRTGGIGVFQEVLAEEVAENNVLYTMCHPVAHVAGRTALESTEDLFGVLDEVAVSTVCDWGFGHGIIDALAERGADRPTMEKLVAWCEKHNGDQRLFGLCADSIGHYSWTSTLDIAESVRGCELIETAYGRTTCGGGVMMQMFEPAASRGSLPREQSHELIPGICERWSKAASTTEGRNGCAHGAGYIFGLEVRDASWERLNDPARDPSERRLPAQNLAEVRSAVERAVTACENLPLEDDAKYDCELQVSHSIPILFAKNYTEDQLGLCSFFASEIARADCQRRAEGKQI